jgi:hypothetical protein
MQKAIYFFDKILQKHCAQFAYFAQFMLSLIIRGQDMLISEEYSSPRIFEIIAPDAALAVSLIE